MKTQISAEIVADSINKKDRLISVLIICPYSSIPTILEHSRDLSMTYNKSEYILFNSVLDQVRYDPFIPIAWPKNHSDMQGNEYFDNHFSITGNYNLDTNYGFWMDARDEAVRYAECLGNEGLTKQLCNRLLEPFMWTTMLITGSEEGWDNFFELRCPQYLYDYEDEPLYFNSKKDWVNYYNESQGYKENNKEFTKIENLTELEWLQINKGQAEIHIMDLAEKIYDAIQSSTFKRLKTKR